MIASSSSAASLPFFALVDTLRPFLVGGLFLPALVTHDALAFAVPSFAFPIAAGPLAGLDAIFPRYFPISFAHGETTRSSPESSSSHPENAPRPTGTAARAISLMNGK